MCMYAISLDLSPEANLVAVCDIRLEVAQAVADECGI